MRRLVIKEHIWKAPPQLYDTLFPFADTYHMRWNSMPGPKNINEKMGGALSGRLWERNIVCSGESLSGGWCFGGPSKTTNLSWSQMVLFNSKIGFWAISWTTCGFETTFPKSALWVRSVKGESWSVVLSLCSSSWWWVLPSSSWWWCAVPLEFRDDDGVRPQECNSQKQNKWYCKASKHETQIY